MHELMGESWIGKHVIKKLMMQIRTHGKVAGWLTRFNWIGCSMQH